MKDLPTHRVTFSAIGLSVVSLWVMGVLVFSDIAYREHYMLLVGGLGLSTLIAILWNAQRQSVRQVKALHQLAQGQLTAPLKEHHKNPGISSINALYYKLREASDYIKTLGETNKTSELHYLNPTEHLGQALLEVKATLQSYRMEEEKRNWSNEGLAYFADILRNHTENSEVFSNEVIRQLVKYLEVNQGAFFIKSEAEGQTWLELTACYAYDKKKHQQKRLALGQGLVGQCALEGKPIYLTSVPDQYTTITSGLGEATPSAIVIVPLLANEEMYGVIELASFTPLTKHKISFLEKLAENIAASLAMVQANAHMQKLLQSSQQLAEEMEKLSLVANNTDNSVVITDQQGRIEFVNQGFINLTGYTENEAMGQKPGHLLQGPGTNPETVERIRWKLKEGNPFYEEILNYRKNGESYWISLMINPIKNEEGTIEKFISIQANVTQIKEKTLDYTYKLEAISRSNAIVEFDTQGNIVDANDLYLSIAGYHKEELLGNKYSYLLPEAEIEKPQTQMMWENLKTGTFFSGEFKQKSKLGKELWLSGTFNPIFDLEDNLRKIMMFAQFTTHEKEKQNDLAGMIQAFTGSVQTFDMSREGNLKKANPLFLQRFGYKRREISNMKLQDLVAEDSPLPDIEMMIQQQTSIDDTLTLVTRSGEAVTCRCSFTSIQNLEGELSKIVVVLREDHA